MKLIENKVWEYNQESGVDGMYKAVRDAASICYQTDVEKMKKAPKEFVETVLLKNGHTRPLEFGTVYLALEVLEGNNDYEHEVNTFTQKYTNNHYSKVVSVEFVKDDEKGRKYANYITTNLRVIMQGDYETDKEAFEHGYDKNWLDDLKYWCEPTEYHEPRRTFTMYMSRGCTDDNRTHISLSSICESTRFCNYSKDKYGNELTFIKPYWIEQEEVNAYFGGFLNRVKFLYKNPKSRKAMKFLMLMNIEEWAYLKMAKLGLQPQQLKRLFPLGVKAELRLCGFDDAWENFFWRRCDTHADPECKIVADKIKYDLW